MPDSRVDVIPDDFEKYDNAIGWITGSWKDNRTVHTLASQMEVLGKNMSKLRGASDTESRKKARIVWQKAAQQYWELLWAIVEAKIDAGPPETLEFDPHERLFIDFGHLCSKYTAPNPAFAEQMGQPSAVDMYQYNRMTDYLKENYALIFGKNYSGPTGGVSLDEKLKRFNSELKGAQTRRRMAMNTLFHDANLIEKPELDGMLKNLEEGLRDAIESDMRTKRVREADNQQRNIIKEHCKSYETAERTFWYLMDSLEKKLTKSKSEHEEAPQAEAAVAENSEESKKNPIDSFDPFEEIDDSFREPEPRAEPEPAPQTAADAPLGQECEYEGSVDDQPPPLAQDKRDQEESLDQSMKIIQNVLSLHDKTKFLAGLIVHVTNEAERWKTRCEMSKNKFKGQGVPAMKMELREGLNHKKDFMLLAAHTARLDPSPLCQNKSLPVSFQRAGEIMMDLTPLDPDMLRASRIRMYGIPRVILVPGQGLGVYDWEDNSLIIPIFPAVSDIKDFSFALSAFRWDNDEDRTLKDTYSLLKANKGKGIRALQESFFNDYFLWITKERKGYKILPREIAKWFKTFFKQKSGVADTKPQSAGGQRR
ncbi:MAG: hypothetical protein LBQ19_06060 [Synergistaceae bacterium]|jgi:hypothetical protein|nr:hypothetical protein [Synergistaceae bacterium]